MFCQGCKLDLPEKEFWKRQNETYSDFYFCKDCLIPKDMTMDNIPKRGFFIELDIPYVVESWNQYRDSKLTKSLRSLYGRYRACMALTDWKSYKYNDTWFLNFLPIVKWGTDDEALETIHNLKKFYELECERESN